MRPLRARIMAGVTARTVLKVPVRSAEMTSSHIWEEVRAASDSRLMPAEATRTSMGP